MAQSDSIADLLTRLRNGAQARHLYVDAHLSRQKIDLLKVLESSGFIDQVLVDSANRKMRIFLKYAEGREPLLQGLKRISKPGRRKYVSADQIPVVQSGLGMAVLSTSKGVVSGQQAAELKVGGELLCYVW